MAKDMDNRDDYQAEIKKWAKDIDDYQERIKKWEEDVSAVYDEVMQKIPNSVFDRIFNLRSIHSDLESDVYNQTSNAGFSLFRAVYNRAFDEMGEKYLPLLKLLISKELKDEGEQ